MSNEFCRCGHLWNMHSPNCEDCGCSAVQREHTGGCKYCGIPIHDASPETRELHEIKHLLELLVEASAFEQPAKLPKGMMPR